MEGCSPTYLCNMIVYNVTVKLQASIHHEWMNWLNKEHIPVVLNTGCFTDVHILRLLHTDDSEGPTYAVQYHAANEAMLNSYIKNFLPAMEQLSLNRWGDQFVSFSTILKRVN